MNFVLNGGDFNGKMATNPLDAMPGPGRRGLVGSVRIDPDIPVSKKKNPLDAATCFALIWFRLAKSYHCEPPFAPFLPIMVHNSISPYTFGRQWNSKWMPNKHSSVFKMFKNTLFLTS